MNANDKYKLDINDTIEVDSRTLYRIVALKSFGVVSEGDKGGYVHSRDNLSQRGNCWIFSGAKVYGDARVYDNCWIFDGAKVYGKAKVYGNARVHDNAEVYDKAEVYGNAKVYSNAKVYDAAEVHGDARVCGAAEVYGNVEVYGNCWIFDNAGVYGNAEVYGDARVCGEAEVDGNAEVYGDARVCGMARVHGDACIDSDVQRTHDYTVFKNVLTSQRYYTYNFNTDRWIIGCFRGSTEDLKLHLKLKGNDAQVMEYTNAIAYVNKLKKFRKQIQMD